MQVPWEATGAQGVTTTCKKSDIICQQFLQSSASRCSGCTPLWENKRRFLRDASSSFVFSCELMSWMDRDKTWCLAVYGLRGSLVAAGYSRVAWPSRSQLKTFQGCVRWARTGQNEWKKKPDPMLHSSTIMLALINWLGRLPRRRDSGIKLILILKWVDIVFVSNMSVFGPRNGHLNVWNWP